jgi:hypothetical protein
MVLIRPKILIPYCEGRGDITTTSLLQAIRICILILILWSDGPLEAFTSQRFSET